MRPRSMKSPAPKEGQPISSFPRDVHVVQLWWTEPIYTCRYNDGLKSLDHTLMTEQYLRWSVNSNCCSRRKTRLLRVEILSWGPWTEKNKYPNILEVFALRAGPSWFLIRSLRLISLYKYQLVFIFRTFELYVIGYYWNSPYDFRNSFLNNNTL